VNEKAGQTQLMYTDREQGDIIMRLRKRVADDLGEVRKAMDATNSKKEFQKLQSIFLADVQPNLSAKAIGDIVQLSTYRVKMVHSNFRKYGMESIKDRRGGRYRENMSFSEEVEFLAPFVIKSQTGALATVGEVKRAYEEKIGREVAESTIYRLLDRHGFRKIVPYKRHKKANIEEQEAFKKTFPPS
jgi:transposase